MKQAGVLMSISSLPSKYGVGDLGPAAYQFVDMLKHAHVHVWQILPFNRLGYGNSPYQTYSSIAGDELFISLDLMVQDGLLSNSDLTYFNEASTHVDYDGVRHFKETYFKQAFKQFKSSFSQFKQDYETFIQENNWVKHYAVFVAFKKANELRSWIEWPLPFKQWINDKKMDLAPYQDEIDYQLFLQFMFYKQWFALKYYTNQLGISIMGDIPYYVGIDSIDCWENQENFLLNEDGHPWFIAGVPPDYFSDTGQRWGNPIYNWDFMKEDGFKFWINRLGLNTKVFDVIRIDHFRAFDTYWKIPASCPTAIEGEWIEAPGYAFFDRLFEIYPTIKVVAEDLGDMRPEVGELRDHYHFAGMKIVQFTFDPNETNNDFEDRENMIIYTGTHDNQTILGWFESQDEETQKATIEFLSQQGYTGTFNEQMIQYTLDSIASLAVIPTQDLLGLDDKARMNVPGTIGSPNWEWKLKDFEALKEAMVQFDAMITQSERTL